MNDTNEPTTTVEDRSGLSRRDMIKASVAAGALVWSAPILLTGKAAAASNTPCCATGTPVRFKLTSATATNCGASCLDNAPSTISSITCSTTVGNCLIQASNSFVKGVFKMGGTQAEVILQPGVTLIAAAAKGTNNCYYTYCTCFTTSQTDNSNCKNTCSTTNGGACGSGVTIPPNRIWVLQNMNGSTPAAGYTTIEVDTGTESLNYVDLALCLAPAITGVCP